MSQIQTPSHGNGEKWITIRLFIIVYFISLLFMDSTSHGVFTATNRFQYLAYALVDHQTIDITAVEEVHGETVEAYEIQGRRVQIINPGVGILVSPIYAISSLLNIEERIGLQSGDDAVILYQGLVFAMAINAMMAAIFVTSLWMILRWLGLTKRLSMALTIGIGWGSMAAYYFTAGTNVQTSVETSLCTLAWLFVIGLDRGRKLPSPAFWAGFFLGIAILVNVPAVITTFGSLLYIFYKHRTKTLSFLCGLLPGVGVLLIYQWIALGNPFMDVPFSYFQSKGMYGNPDNISFLQVATEFLLGWHQGMLWYFPLSICLLFTIRGVYARNGLVVISWTLIVLHWIFATWYTHLWIQTEEMLSFYPWYSTPGPGGPRYLIPAVPFVAILISQLDFRSLYLKTMITWLGFIGICLNIPVLMYPAGGPVFRSFFLMLKYGIHIPIVRVFYGFLYGEIPVGGMEITNVITWLIVLLGSVYWVWGNTKLRDWLFYNQNS